MKVHELYKKFSKVISFEFFPPKTDEGEEKLFRVAAELKRLNPAFISVTYGAMGTTRDNTLRIVTKIKKEVGIESAAHLTCVAHSKDEIRTILADLLKNGIENIVALRGDAPRGETAFQPVPDGFRYASELVHFIRSDPQYANAFSLLVAGYPEGHPETADKEQDLKNLAQKVKQGANVVTTQLFFHNEFYFRFVDRARSLGIQIPIVPGIMPVTHGPQIKKFAGLCGASIPREMEDAIHRYGDDQASVEEFGIEYATRQCEELLEKGAPGLHFYTLNKSNATRRIYQNLFR